MRTWLVMLLVVMARVAAADPERPDDTMVYSCRHLPEQVQITFKPEIEVKELITWAMGFTCNRYLYDNRYVQNRHVTVIAPEKMSPLLDDTARLQYTTSATLQQLVTQGKYFIPIATSMGVSMNTIFQYLAIMGQLGALSGRGGTSVKNIVEGAMSVTPTAHLSAAKFSALQDLGLRDKRLRRRQGER